MSFNLATLDSGARLLTVPTAGTEAVTILVSVQTGSRNETAKENGLSHYLEHMFFKGSRDYPSAIELASTLDGLGADYNAWTGKEFTEYFIKVPADEFPRALTIMSDLFVRPLFPESEFEKEKQVILQEINMYEDSPDRYVNDLMEQALFTGHPMAQLIIGSRKTIADFDRTALIDYWKRQYRPQATLITLAGKLGNADYQSKVAEAFPLTGGVKSRSVAPVGALLLPKISIFDKKTEQVHLSIGFRGLSYADPKRAAIRVAAIILGGTMSSRLFHEVREKRGLCYYIRAVAQGYSDTGYLEVAAGLDRTRLDEALKVIMAECHRLALDVSEEELRRAKAFVKGKLLLRLEQSDELADFYSTQVFLGKTILSPNEWLAEIQSVTLSQVKSVATEILQPKQAALAVIGEGIVESSLEGYLKN